MTARPKSLTRSTAPNSSRPSGPSTAPSIKEPAHLPLHRRLLFPTLPPSQPLPALVPGSGSDPDIAQLNEKIYTLIALAFRAYILTWLPRITRDRSILPQIHQSLVAPLLVPIFASLHSDPERLIPCVLYDLPALLTRHWQVYWQARAAADQQLPYEHGVADGLTGGGGDAPAGLDAIYHAHLPLRSVERTTAASDAEAPEPDKTVIPAGTCVVSPLWLGALVDNLMKRNLPPEEYAVDVERAMMRDILARTVLGGIARRVSEPAFWYALLLRFIPVRQSRDESSAAASATASGAGLGRRSRGGIALLSKLRNAVDRLVAVCVSLWAMGTWVVAAYTAAPPSTYSQTTRCWLELGREVLSVDGRQGWTNWPLRILWSSLEIFVQLLSPLLDRQKCMDRAHTRLLPHLLRIHLHPKTALRLVDLLERILFPLDGYPAPTPPDPSQEETVAMRREIEERLGLLIPGTYDVDSMMRLHYEASLTADPVRRVVVPSHTDVEWLLSPLSHAGCNAHLVAVLYAAAVGVLVPEMVVGAPSMPGKT